MSTNPDTTTKSRPSASCIPCRNRKVKCTRTTPCTTCISRNHPEECIYTASDIDREAMRQADVIAQLRGRVRNLRSVVASLPSSAASSGVSSGEKEETGEGIGDQTDDEDIVYKALCQGGPQVVQDIVTQLRGGIPIEEIARSINYT